MFVGGGGQAHCCAPCERQNQFETIIGSYLLACCSVLGLGELKRQGQKEMQDIHRLKAMDVWTRYDSTARTEVHPHFLQHTALYRDDLSPLPD